MWLKLLAKMAKASIKKIILSALAVLRANTDDVSVEVLKGAIKREIQRQRKVPGTLRMLACWWVDDQDADDVIGYLNKLEASLA